MKSIKCYSFLFFMVLFSCNSESESPEFQPRPTKKVYMDPSFSNYPEQAVDLYTAYNDRGNINLIKKQEIDCINSFISKKVSAIFVGRNLREDEKKAVTSGGFKLYSQLILKDALVFICNKSQKDSLWKVSDLEAVLLSNTEKWSNGKPIQMIFDGLQGSNFNYMLDRLNLKSYPSNVRRLNSSEEVIDFISKNTESIGIIGLSVIGNLKTDKVKTLRNKITIMGLSTDGKTYYQPLRDNLLFKKYPYERMLWYHTLHRKSTLEGGLLDFMMSSGGQLLTEKCGLLQGIPTGRELEISIQGKKKKKKRTIFDLD